MGSLFYSQPSLLLPGAGTTLATIEMLTAELQLEPAQVRLHVLFIFFCFCSIHNRDAGGGAAAGAHGCTPDFSFFFLSMPDLPRLRLD